MKYFGRWISHRQSLKGIKRCCHKRFHFRLMGFCTFALESSLGFLYLAIWYFPPACHLTLSCGINSTNPFLFEMGMITNISVLISWFVSQEECLDLSINWWIHTKAKKDYAVCVGSSYASFESDVQELKWNSIQGLELDAWNKLQGWWCIDAFCLSCVSGFFHKHPLCSEDNIGELRSLSIRNLNFKKPQVMGNANHKPWDE